ncbi:MAG: hypothetical protein PHQ72_02155 [Hespellia sp.]|nr:hypothetical protein [Hespellia sp.]
MNKICKSKIVHVLRDLRENMCVFISFILAIFPLSFVLNSYLLAARNMDENRGSENIETVFLYVLIFLLIGLMLILIYILNSYIKIKAPKYSLLFILGIKKKEFWKILFKDYFATSLLMGTVSAITINFVSFCMASIMWNRSNEIVLAHIWKIYFIGTGIVCFILVLLIFVTAGIVFYYSLDKKMIDFWENINKNIIFEYENKLLYYIKPIIGIIAEIAVLVFCLNYKTIYYAAILQVISFYFIVSSTECLRWISRSNRKDNYKNIISSHALMYQYKLNSKLIVVIYLLSFIVTFVIGGFILSDLSGNTNKNYYVKYPYEYVVYGERALNDNQESYPFFQGKTEEGKIVAIFSVSSYEKITRKKFFISEKELLYISQLEPEEFKPLADKQELKIFFDKEEENYIVKDSSWEILFGENISSELENILIINDTEFESKATKIKNLWFGNVNKYKQGKLLHVWNRTEAVKKEKDESSYLSSLMYIIGAFLILEGQGIVLMKQLVNHFTTKRKYELLYILGITKKDKKKYFFAEIRKIAFLPTVLGSVTGALLLEINYFYQEGLRGEVFIFYTLLCVALLLMQYGGYYCITLLMMKLYKHDLGLV